MTNNGAAPLCARHLADWGADVIWVEPIDGAIERVADGGLCKLTTEMANDHITQLLEFQNANKRSFCLDRRNPEAIDILYKLLDTCDVFLTNNRNEALAKMGLDWKTLHKKFPKLIFAHLTGYGENGPDKNAPGFDIVSFLGRAGIGMAFASRDSDAVPYTPMGLGDNIAGSMLAGGIAAALVEQQKTGKGDFVSISLYAAGVYAVGLFVIAAQYGTYEWPMSRKKSMPGGVTYRCSDGKFIQAAWHATEAAQDRACKALGCEELIGDPRFSNSVSRMQNAATLIEIWDKCFLKHTADEWCKIFEEYDLAHSKLRTIDEILTDPQAIENFDIYKIKNRADGSDTWIPNMPIHIGEDYKPRHRSVPLQGEHTVEIMRSLGYDEAYIQDCIARKVVRDVYPEDPSKYPPQDMPEYE